MRHGPKRNFLGPAVKISAVTFTLAVIIWLAGLGTGFTGDCAPEGKQAGAGEASISLWPPGERCVERAKGAAAQHADAYVRDPGPAIGKVVGVLGGLTALVLLAGIAFELSTLRTRST